MLNYYSALSVISQEKFFSLRLHIADMAHRCSKRGGVMLGHISFSYMGLLLFILHLLWMHLAIGCIGICFLYCQALP